MFEIDDRGHYWYVAREGQVVIARVPIIPQYIAG